MGQTSPALDHGAGRWFHWRHVFYGAECAGRRVRPQGRVARRLLHDNPAARAHEPGTSDCSPRSSSTVDVTFTTSHANVPTACANIDLILQGAGG